MSDLLTSAHFPLAFDEVAHAYTWRGQPVPSVTQVLKDLKLAPPYPADRGWLEFGRAVHKCLELLLWGRLKIEDGSEDRYPGTSKLLWPYIDAARQKIKEYRVRPIRTEFRVYHDQLGVAGTLDLHCTIFNDEEAIWDYKTGNPPECTALQLALYDKGLNRTLGLPDRRRRRFALYLFTDDVKETGRAKMIEFTDPFAYDAAAGAVAVWKWKNRNGRKL